MIKLTNRLQACADLVRDGARICDIGCDHGYVPVYLVTTGKCPSAVASDINEGPLTACRRLVEDYGLEDTVRCVLSDGLKSIDLDETDDILIAGMGGILMEEILNDCDLEQLMDKHLILNPMTHPEHARGWLYGNTFEILNDIIVADGEHHYNIIDARFRGTLQEYSMTDLFLGKITDFSDKEYFNHLLRYLKSKEKGGFDYSEVIQAIEEKIK